MGIRSNERARELWSISSAEVTNIWRKADMDT